MSKKNVVVLGVLTAAALVAVISMSIILKRDDIRRSIERASLPEEVAYHEITTAPESPDSINTATPQKTAITPLPKESTRPAATASPTTTEKIPAEINLAIPFTSQAPHGTWELPYKEFCEEASVLMVMRYLKNQPIGNADAAAAGMNEIRVFEEQEFGYYEDTTAAETAQIIKKHFNFSSVRLLENPTVEQIKQALAAGKPVIVPAAGRQLGNPYYTPPGPLYHMLVIKGYTADNKFITNDPGTRRGAEFLYDTNILMNAIHDWHGDENIEAGRQVVLIVG